MRNLRPHQESIAKVWATISQSSITDLQNVVATILERVNRLRLSALDVDMRLVTVGIEGNRSHLMHIRDDLPVLAIDNRQSWIELGRLDVRSLKLKCQFLARFNRELEAVQVAGTLNHT